MHLEPFSPRYVNSTRSQQPCPPRAPSLYIPCLPLLNRLRERSPALPAGLFNWFGAFFKIPDTYVLNHQSIDGYLLLRFLRIATTICLVGCIITFPVLFPVNITGGGGLVQLDILTFGNVAGHGNPRFYAHTFVAWIYFGAPSTGPSRFPASYTNMSV